MTGHDPAGIDGARRGATVLNGWRRSSFGDLRSHSAARDLRTASRLLQRLRTERIGHPYLDYFLGRSRDGYVDTSDPRVELLVPDAGQSWTIDEIHVIAPEPHRSKTRDRLTAGGYRLADDLTRRDVLTLRGSGPRTRGWHER